RRDGLVAPNLGLIEPARVDVTGEHEAQVCARVEQEDRESPEDDGDPRRRAGRRDAPEIRDQECDDESVTDVTPAVREGQMERGRGDERGQCRREEPGDREDDPEEQEVRDGPGPLLFPGRECCRRIVSRSAWPRPAFAASYSSRMVFGTPTKTSPPVGGTSFRIPLPVVVFPHPLSPTRQKISPLPTSRSTPSTARTYSGVAFRSASRNPRRFSNQTRKSRRTRYGSRANSHRLLRRRSRGVQVAGGEMAFSHGVEP